MSNQTQTVRVRVVRQVHTSSIDDFYGKEFDAVEDGNYFVITDSEGYEYSLPKSAFIIIDNPTEQPKAEEKRYYYDFDYLWELQNNVLVVEAGKGIPVSPELQSAWKDKKGEKILGKDFELQYEAWQFHAEWPKVSKEIYDNTIPANRRITAILPKAEGKAEENSQRNFTPSNIEAEDREKEIPEANQLLLQAASIFNRNKMLFPERVEIAVDVWLEDYNNYKLEKKLP